MQMMLFLLSWVNLKVNLEEHLANHPYCDHPASFSQAPWLFEALFGC